MPGKFGTGAGGGTVTTPANVPTTPLFVRNTDLKVTSSNDVLVFTSDQGGPVSIDIDDGVYSPDARATELQTKMNANTTLTGSGTITFADTYDSATKYYDIDAGTGHTIAYTQSGSDGGAAFGLTANAAAAQVIYSDTPVEGSLTITLFFTENGNSEVCEYAIKNVTTGTWIATDGSDNGASEDWALFADWDNGGADGTVTITGLSSGTAYKFQVKAKNEAGVETALSSESAQMMTCLNLDPGNFSEAYEREVMTGEVKIDRDGYGTGIAIETSGTYGDITVKVYAKSNDNRNWRAETRFREKLEGSDTWDEWKTATMSGAVTGLSSSQAGTEVPLAFDSYTSCGLSEKKETAVQIEVTPFDASPTGGNAGEPRTSEIFTVNNRPGTPEVECVDTFTYGMDTTPDVQEVMQPIRGGTALYFEIKVVDKADATVFQTSSGEVLDGWWYENTPGNWNAVTASGVAAANIDGVNKYMFIIPAWLALTADNDNPYRFYVRQLEARERGV